MITLAELIGKAETVLAEMDTLQAQLDAEPDAEKRKPVEEALKGKDAEFKAFKEKIETAKSQAARRVALQAAKKAAETDVDGKTLTPKIPAEPKDHEKEAQAKRRAFLDYCNGKDVEPGLMVEMRPELPKFKDKLDGVRMPPDMVVQIFGDEYAKVAGLPAGKAIPMVSGDAARSALIPQDYRRELLELDAEAPHILGRATIVPSDTGAIVWPRLVQTDAQEYGGVTVSWIDEGGEKPETEPEFEQVTIETHEVAAYTEISNRLLNRSAIPLEPLLTRLFKGALNHALDVAFLSGSGTGQPTGIVNTTGIRTVNRTAQNDIQYDDLVNLEFAVRAYHRARATYIVADGCMQNLKKDKDTQGRPLFVESVAGQVFQKLVGYPYISTHRLTAYADGDVIFGDLKEYIVPIEQEVVVKRSEHYNFRKNVTAFTVSAAVGGQLVQPRAMAILQAGTS